MTDARRSDRQQTSDEWTAMVASKAARREPVTRDLMMNDGPTDVTTAILTDRGQKYGAYIEQAQTAQRLKRILADVVATRVTPIRSDAAESMQMICTKLSRLVHGDPEHLDSWDDIAGYARLVADRLRGVER